MAIDNLTDTRVETVDTTPPAADATPYISPGYTPRKPPRTRTGSAAMVVARAGGRGLGTSTRWIFTGVARSGRQWADLYHDDYPHMISLAKEELKAAKDTGEAAEAKTTVKQWRREHRRHRLQHLGRTSVGTLATSGTLALGGLVIGGWLDLLLAGVGLGATAWHGQRGTGPAAIEAAPEAPMLGTGGPQVDDGEPFPLAWCKDGDQVRVCIERALKAESIGTRSINILGYRGWGWEVDVDLKGSTPGKVNAAGDQLDTHFDIKRGGTLTEPDLQRAAHVVLRLITDDPFANMPKVQVHAPNSVDISEPVNMFAGMDGSRPEIVLEGTRILAIGVSGSAKSTGVLRDIAEVVTAADNAIALDLDPVKDGLREFEGVMAAPPIRGNKACEEWSGYLVRMAEARNAVRNRLNMGDTWVATRQHPAIFPFYDEFIYLSPKAKEDFIKLLRLGKQTGIYPIAAGQDATSDSMGDAIADSFTLRIMLASRHADIPLVLGSGAIAAGWRPDRLQPAQTSKIRNDAGRSYIKGAGLDRPILYGWNELSRDQIKRAVADRAAAGRPWFDYDTLAAADLLHVITPNGRVGEASLADRLDAFAEQGGVEDARLVAVLLREFERGSAAFLSTNETLLPALTGSGFEDVDAEKLSRILRKHAPGVTAARDNGAPGKPRGWERTAIEQVAAGLLNPVQARSQAG